MNGTLNRSGLWTTPLRDLVRGRVTGRLDTRGRLARAALPVEVEALILRVVRRTRLWRLEKADVAGELIAHFADGLAGGASADDLVRDFGDERAAAKLIRRAKKRNRPLPWHAMKYAGYTMLVLVALLGIQFARFMLRTPTVSVDYVAMLNAPIDALRTDARAWPLYREAILSLDLAHDEAWQQPLSEPPDEGNYRSTLGYARPIDPEWPRLVAWLDARSPQIELIRRAAAKPVLGFRLGVNGDVNDPELRAIEPERYAMAWHGSRDADSSPRELLDDSMASVIVPYLNHQRALSNLLAADFRVALEQGDGDRVLQDLLATRGMARQLRGPMLVSQLVSIGIDSMLLRQLSQLLREQPELLDEAAWIILAHALVDLGGETASTVIDLSGERAFQADMLQRIYTDDGAGDGYLTSAALQPPKEIGRASGIWDWHSSRWANAGLMLVGSTTSPVKTRRAATEELDRMMTLVERCLSRPRWQVEAENLDKFDPIEARTAEIRDSSLDLLRLYPVTVLMPALNGAQITAERLIAERNGIATGIALELYRRRHHGVYPDSLEALVPAFLPALPIDRITGDPLLYRLIDGKPVVYSAGVDHDDDGGTPVVDPRTQAPDPERAGHWRRSTREPPPDGDWILFDARRPEGVLP